MLLLGNRIDYYSVFFFLITKISIYAMIFQQQKAERCNPTLMPVFMLSSFALSTRRIITHAKSIISPESVKRKQLCWPRWRHRLSPSPHRKGFPWGNYIASLRWLTENILSDALESHVICKRNRTFRASGGTKVVVVVVFDFEICHVSFILTLRKTDY